MTKQILNVWFAFISKFITWHCTVYTILEIHGPGYRDLNNITSVTSVHRRYYFSSLNYYSNITSVNTDQVPTSPWFGWADWLRRAGFLLSRESAVPYRIGHARRQLAVSRCAGCPLSLAGPRLSPRSRQLSIQEKSVTQIRAQLYYCNTLGMFLHTWGMFSRI